MHERTSPAADGRIVPITFALGLGAFLTLFDVTAVVVAMPGIAKDLGFAVAGAAWVIDAYSLAFTGALLASGALADRFGRRRSMLIGNAVFLVASIACGLATDGPMLLASRVVQGVGAAFMVTGATALIAGAFPNLGQPGTGVRHDWGNCRRRHGLGPDLGRLARLMVRLALDLLRQYPLCLSLTIVVPRFVAETNDPDGPPLDPVGVALLTISLGLAIDALLRRDGSLAIRAACLAGSAMASLLFVLQQWRRSRPVLDPRVFATSAMAGVGALLTAIQFGYWAVLVYLPLFLSTALLVSIEVAGVALLAATLPMLMVPLIGGRLVTQWGWRCFFVVAFGIMAAGDALLALATVSTSPAMRLAATIAGMLTIGIGAALANPQMSSVVLALAPPTQAGMASAVTMIVRQAGFAISIAALGATLTRTDMATAFAAPFALATLAALAAIAAAIILLPAQSSQKDTSQKDVSG